MTRAVIFDTETTGGDLAHLIEAGGIVLPEGDQIDLRVDYTFCNRYNPGVPSTLGALATHHILDTDLEGKPSPDMFTLPSGTTHLIGHNVDYDWEVVGKPAVKRICTLALARRIWPTLDSHSLGALLYYVMGSFARKMLREAHAADVDCENTRHLLRHVIAGLKKADLGRVETWDDLWILSEQARVPTHMPFGKHKGMAIAELPADYVDWLMRQTDIDEYLKLAIKAR